MPTEIFDLLKLLDRERYRAAIIHTSPEKSPALTDFCKKFCQQKGGKYLDLLEFFIQSPTLSEAIDRFSPENLRMLLIEQSRGETLLVLDRPDFLLDTWRNSERQDFYRLINNQWDGYKVSMKAKLIVALQTSVEVGDLKIVDSTGQSRVFRLIDFNDIA